METAIGRHRVRRCAALALSAGLGLLAGLAPVFGEPVDPRDDSVWLRDGRLEIQRLIVVDSVRSGAVPAPLALAVAGVESGFVAETLGASGKVGVMQLLPSVAVSEFGADAGNLGDPATGTQQTSADAGTPILFIGNDEDPNALIRSNRMFERVFAGLHRELASQGYDLIDEALAAVDLGRTISDRRSRAEIAELIRILHESDDASQEMQAAVLIAIRIWHRTGSTFSRIRVEFGVEIYDPAGKRRLIAFRFPSDSSSGDPLVFPAPLKCGFNCVIAIVADHVDDVCEDLARLLARELDSSILSP